MMWKKVTYLDGLRVSKLVAQFHFGWTMPLRWIKWVKVIVHLKMKINYKDNILKNIGIQTTLDATDFV